MEEKIYDTLIVGSGPAGLTAAIYNIRSALKTMVIAGDQPGGQLTITTLVDNFPGFAHGIGGVKLMMDMQEQVKNLGGEIRNGLVTAISNFQFPISKQIPNSNNQITNGFEVKFADGEILQTKAVIVATGAKAKWLGIPGEKEFLGKGVSGCATCDGVFCKDKIVAIVGGGNTACTESDFLTKFGRVVYLIHRRDELRATPAEQKNVINNPKVKFLWNTEVKEVTGTDKVEKIKIVNNKTGEESWLPVDGLFVAIGRDPETDFVKEIGVERDEKGSIIVGKNGEYPMMTNIEGIFAAGDCTKTKYMQAITAAGDGAKAGLDAEKWLENQ